MVRYLLLFCCYTNRYWCTLVQCTFMIRVIRLSVLILVQESDFMPFSGKRLTIKPIRAPTNVRSTVRWDYEPMLCKVRRNRSIISFYCFLTWYLVWLEDDILWKNCTGYGTNTSFQLYWHTLFSPNIQFGAYLLPYFKTVRFLFSIFSLILCLYSGV